MASNQTKTISLSSYGIKSNNVFYQLSPEKLHQISVKNKLGVETSSGALAVNTGEFTGRSPMDRFIVRDEITEEKVWWGDVNIPFKSSDFDKLYSRVIKYLDGKDLYVRDCFACAELRNKIGVRVINEYPWSNMFAYNNAKCLHGSDREDGVNKMILLTIHKAKDKQAMEEHFKRSAVKYPGRFKYS